METTFCYVLYILIFGAHWHVLRSTREFCCNLTRNKIISCGLRSSPYYYYSCTSSPKNRTCWADNPWLFHWSVGRKLTSKKLNTGIILRILLANIELNRCYVLPFFKYLNKMYLFIIR